MSEPIRVLHVFGRLNPNGGAEKWVLDLLRRQDSRIRFDFLLSLDDDPTVEEARRLGSTVYRIPFSRSPLPWSGGNPYLKAFRELLRAERFDVVHTHQFDLSGEILRIAEQEGVPGRIMSVHATEYENPRFYRRMVHRYWGRPWIFRHATAILPCSDAVLRSFLPSGADRSKFHVLYTGIDSEVFRQAGIRRQRDSMRSKLCRAMGIPEHASVLGHVGRFTRQKNHGFLLDLLRERIREDGDFYAVLVGQGELLEPIRRRIDRMGLRDRILTPGPRTDLPDLFVSLFDVFVLPSLYEGLPIVGIEALASGLGLVLSDRVCDELNPCFPNRVRQVPLEASIASWTEAIETMRKARIEPEDALVELSRTPFSIATSLEQIVSFYLHYD